MNIEDYREFCLGKAGVTEGFPFDEDTLVFKAGGKMFALASLSEGTINLKCDPELALELRDKYPAIQAGYHMNKNHWNTLYPDGSLSDELLCSLTDHSYDLVVHSLPVRTQTMLRKGC